MSVRSPANGSAGQIPTTPPIPAALKIKRHGTSASGRRKPSETQSIESSNHNRSISTPVALAATNLAHMAARDKDQLDLTSYQNESSDRAPRGSIPINKQISDESKPEFDQEATVDAFADFKDGKEDPSSKTAGPTRPGASRQAASHSEMSKPVAASALAQQTRKRMVVETKSGTWEMLKTIGAGSMGKVKLAKNQDTRELVAIKIIPRGSTDEHKTQAEKDRADRSKEIRTSREAAISTLVHHPYICSMRDCVKTKYHWYMLFEHVDGGQMLDYIISHGRLKEKQARKFGRQIASALDYCHRNNIVHRDLKIENILISKSGDIKIIDFGLSNTFTPHKKLKTFCGSLYFAAPELLQAKQYTGPEVDVWSFGIVLYVLVCGKVPFDDQSMPALHAKIKKGIVEYPTWLTSECRAIIARMLHVDPMLRAELAEIMNHAWMIKGFGNPPDNFVPTRAPLIDTERAVIRKMDGFDFGTPWDVETKLKEIISSPDYKTAIMKYERKKAAALSEGDKKRGGVFDFYKKRSSVSRETPLLSSAEPVHWGSDPIHSFHPLVSVYFLAKEKLDRERPMDAYRAPTPPPPIASAPATPPVPSTPLMPIFPPEAAHIARATQEDEIISPGTVPVKPNGDANDPAAKDTKYVEVITPVKKESVAAGVFRKLSTRIRKDKSAPRAGGTSPKTPETPAPDSATEPPRKSFSLRRREKSASGVDLVDVQPKPCEVNGQHDSDPAVQENEYAMPSPPSNLVRKGGIGRSFSVNSASIRRKLARPVFGESGFFTRTPSHKNKSSSDQVQDGNDGVTSEVENSKLMYSNPSRKESVGNLSRKGSERRRLRRRPSQLSQTTEPVPSDLVPATPKPRVDVLSAEKQMVETVDATDAEIAHESYEAESARPVFLKGLFSVSTTSSKPFQDIEAEIERALQKLHITYDHRGKGIYSCRWLPRQFPPAEMHVQSRPGTSSIVTDLESKPEYRAESQLESRPESRPYSRPDTRPDSRPDTRPDSRPDTRASSSRVTTMDLSNRISDNPPQLTSESPGVRKTSFGFFQALGEEERAFLRDIKTPETPQTSFSGNGDDEMSAVFSPVTPQLESNKSSRRPSRFTATRSARQSLGSTAQQEIFSPAITSPSIAGAPEDVYSEIVRSPSQQVAGETTTHVQFDMGNNMKLEFFIYIVKVPFLAMYGIQFKKIRGGTWKYKNLAQTILDELQL